MTEVTGYAYEFKNQDSFAMASLDNVITTSSESVMSSHMKNSIKNYKDSLEKDIVSYSAYQYMQNNIMDWVMDAFDVSTTLLDAKSKLLLFAWSFDKENKPFYKDGLSETNSFLQSMYAGIIQADAYVDYQDRRNATFSDVKNITPENLYEVSQSCYAYLKSCYITRDAALGSLTDKTKENNPNYESTQKMVNQEIADCLVKLRNADETNKYGCYGFLSEDNEKYLKDCDDSRIVSVIQTKGELAGLAGTWKIDSLTTNDKNEMSLTNMFGSGLTHYGEELKIDANGKFSYYIGIGIGGEGNCYIENNLLLYTITTYETPQQISDSITIGENQEYLLMEYDGYKIYWIREGAESMTPVVDNDIIELSEYFGTDISQLDEKFTFTNEGDTDWNKFKQNYCITFISPLKDNLINEIDVSQGVYALYGIKCDMNIEDAKILLNNSSEWIIQKEDADVILCKNKSFERYLDITVSNNKIERMSLHSDGIFCGYEEEHGY